MKKLFCLCALALVGGCSLNQQVPKATISFNPSTHAFEIQSHKDVVLSNVVVTVAGTNVNLSIGYYSAAANIAVIKAAVRAQQQQIQGIQNGAADIIGAAVKGGGL